MIPSSNANSIIFSISSSSIYGDSLMIAGLFFRLMASGCTISFGSSSFVNELKPANLKNNSNSSRLPLVIYLKIKCGKVLYIFIVI